MGSNPKPTTTFSYEVLSSLAARLWDASEDLAASLDYEPLCVDLRIAGRALSRFASLRYRLVEIAIAPTTPPATRVAIADVLSATANADNGEPSTARANPNGGLIVTFQRVGEIPEIIWARDGHEAGSRALIAIAQRVVLCPGDRLTVNKATELPTGELPEASRSSHYS